METLTLLSKSEIQNMIDDAITNFLNKPIVKPSLNLSPKEAIIYLAEIGYKCSESQLYKLTMKNEIPFTKYGRRMSFTKHELSEWTETKKTKVIDSDLGKVVYKKSGR